MNNKGAILILVFLFFLSLSNSDAQYDFTQLDSILKTNRQILGKNMCMLVLRGNKVIYEKDLGKYSKNTCEPIASCSKWISAALLMTFVDKGELSLEDYVGKYLPEYSKNGKEFIKLKHCLSHTTAIESEPITLASIIKRNKFETLDDEVRSFTLKKMAGKPGDVFAYSNIGLNVVGRILEVISGKDFETLFRERIAEPLEMKNTTFNHEGRAINPSGGAISNASDYMNFLSMILDNGIFKGRRVLSEKSIELMQTSQTSGIKVIYTPEGTENFEYAFGEWVQKKDDNGRSIVISSPGLFGTYPYIDLNRKYAAIVFVKNLKIRNRRETDELIKNAVDKGIEKVKP